MSLDAGDMVGISGLLEGDVNIYIEEVTVVWLIKGWFCYPYKSFENYF